MAFSSPRAASFENSSLVGALRFRVNIETPTKTPDRAGGYTETWNRLRTCWAAIEPYAARPVASGLGEAQGVFYRVTVRAGISVPREARLAYKRRVLRIESRFTSGKMRRWQVLLYREER